MEIETVKGFRDILPPSSLKRQKIKQIIEKNFRLFGFVPIETPTIEYEEIVKGDNENDSAVSERFRLQDRGNRALALRYEFTFQLKRLFKENQEIKLPFRRYQIGTIFRDEPISKDRYREFVQCDADIIGDSSIKADVECLALAGKICSEIGIKYTLKINNRKLLNAILERLDIENKAEVLREIDKLEKLNEDEIKKNLTKYADKLQILDLFKLLNKDLDFFVKENFNGASEIKELLDLCKIYKIKAEFSPFLSRGFSYYTGTIFEAYNEELKGSIFAGGRFDNLVGKYINKNIPAVGISFGRILDYPNIEVEQAKCILISINQDKKTIELMNDLRENNISCFSMDKISKAMEFANSQKIPFVIFIGDKEIKSKKYTMKNMQTGKEKLISIKSIVKELIK
jgi:histidyl-tRNA synthetase